MRLLAVILPLATCLAVSRAYSFPNLDNFCANKPDGKYPHPMCTKFIHCSNHLTYIKDCALGTRYNVVTKNCDIHHACGHRVRPCRKNPCRNGGTCIAKGSGYLCVCYSGYTGRKCQISRRQCRDTNGCLYSPGMSYISANCRSRCTCLPNGRTACVSLCPPRPVRCPSGHRVEDYYEPVRGSYCQCRRQRCVRVRPLVDCRKAPSGRYPHPVQCSYYLVCQNSMRFTLKCGYGLHFNPIRKACDKPANAGCGRRNECVPGPLKGKCRFEGKVYRAGQKFVNRACTGYCTCSSGGGVGCVSLCPPVVVRCKPYQRKETYRVHPIRGSKCTCTRKRCVRRFTVNDFTDLV